MAVFGCLSVPLQSFGRIPGNAELSPDGRPPRDQSARLALSMVIIAPEVELSLGVALVGGFPVPLEDFVVIIIQPARPVVKITQDKLGRRITTFG
jgi:hypothetical protein